MKEPIILDYMGHRYRRGLDSFYPLFSSSCSAGTAWIVIESFSGRANLLTMKELMNLGGLLGRAVQGSFTILRTKCIRVLGHYLYQYQGYSDSWIYPKLSPHLLMIEEKSTKTRHHWGRSSCQSIDTHSAKGNWIHNDILTFCLKTPWRPSRILNQGDGQTTPNLGIIQMT